MGSANSDTLAQVRMSRPLHPTSQQESKCYVLCQNLTASFLSIHILRLDERTGNIYILAGEETEILIFRDGQWRHLA